MTDVVRLKITLRDTEPAIWRRLEVMSCITLKDLHAVIQAAMGWENYHLYQFHVGHETINGPGFNEPGFSSPGTLTAARVNLDGLIHGEVRRFRYLYDMGDGWEHEVRIEKLLPADGGVVYPRYIDGAGACPPEDVGGIPGFYNFLEVLNDPDHPDREELLEWHGGRYDPAKLEETKINQRLARLSRPRKRKAA